MFKVSHRLAEHVHFVAVGQVICAGLRPLMVVPHYGEARMARDEKLWAAYAIGC